ncbi:PREDICTED: inositol 1,4,5-trisphosphate receptor type 3-like [Amphimedon queenslandica]|nr:PREDICTED: inositol 1,4,5-trisphosphate receptor type 3-like [Amphimedon queenslandica]|eukprot:XP_019863943.1 PREDICTED: inositol 1,4,5-trisphosphate receptor type 3-like [Amphimedon queenslandica]
MINKQRLISSIICLLNEMFFNNSTLCNKLSNEDISNIFRTAITNSEHHQLIITLIIIIEGTIPSLPLQEYVATLVEHHSNDILKSILGQEKETEVIDILKSTKSDTVQNGQLQLLLNLTHLLASCYAKKCQVAIESAEFYSLEELIMIITDDAIDDYKKLPFIRVLTWQHLVTEKNTSPVCSKLANSESYSFWKVLKKFICAIKNLKETIVSSDEMEKSQLIGFKKSDLSICVLTIVRRDQSVSKDKDFQLLYIVEGVIPLLSAFCQELFLHLYAETKFFGIPENTDICGIVEPLYDELKGFRGLKVHSVLEQMHETGCIENVKKLCNHCFKDSIEAPLSTDEIDAGIPNDECFNAEEENLNKKFQKFVTNYSYAYNESRPNMESNFEELLKIFTDQEYTRKLDELRVNKLVIVLRTLIEKQKELGLHCIERTNLERMTSTTLKLIHALVFKKVREIDDKRNSLKPIEFQRQCKKFVRPLQAILLDKEIDLVPTLFELLRHPNDDITDQILACLDVLLYPGNEEAQRKVMSLGVQSLFICLQKKLKGAQDNLDKAKTGESESRNITVVLDVLVRLCDGQQKDIQNALSGTLTLHGSNIVSQVSFLLLGILEGHAAEILKEADIIIIAQKATKALIEMCTGNHNNQRIAFKCQVIISVNLVLDLDIGSTTSHEAKRFLELKSSSLELLEIMLEEIDEESSKLASWILQQLDVSGLLKGMLQLWKIFKASPPKNHSQNSLFRAYHALRRISDHQGISIDELVIHANQGLANTFDHVFKDDMVEAKKMWEDCRKWSRSVEVVFKPGSDREILTQAYFPCSPNTHLSQQEKDTIILYIKRNTPQEKLSDLLKWTKEIKSNEEQKEMLSKSWKTSFILWFYPTVHFILFWLTIFLNLIVLFGIRSPSAAVTNNNNEACSVVFNGTCNSSSPMHFQPILSPDVPSWYMPVHYTFGSLHLILALWMVIYYFVTNCKNMRRSVYCIQKYLFKISKGVIRRKRLHQFLCKLNLKISADKPKPKEYFQIFFFSFEPLYRILFLIFSGLGLATTGYFYCGCMLYLFLRNHVMFFIIRALKKSAFQLLTVLLLCFICTYIYAVVSFAFLQNYFSEGNDQFCNTLFECFITATRLGLLNTLGLELGIRPSDEYEPNFRLLIVRTVYDLIFFVVVTTLGLNIVVAILVDRFSEMREERDKVTDDNKNRCLVCSIMKDDFERKGQSFDKHINEDHNVWNYIHFILYINNLHENDYNAVEKYVSCQVENGSIDFFPIFKSKSLPEYKNEE